MDSMKNFCKQGVKWEETKDRKKSTATFGKLSPTFVTGGEDQVSPKVNKNYILQHLTTLKVNSRSTLLKSVTMSRLLFKIH